MTRRSNVSCLKSKKETHALAFSSIFYLSGLSVSMNAVAVKKKELNRKIWRGLANTGAVALKIIIFFHSFVQCLVSVCLICLIYTFHLLPPLLTYPFSSRFIFESAWVCIATGKCCVQFPEEQTEKIHNSLCVCDIGYSLLLESRSLSLSRSTTNAVESSKNKTVCNSHS